MLVDPILCLIIHELNVSPIYPLTGSKIANITGMTAEEQEAAKAAAEAVAAENAKDGTGGDGSDGEGTGQCMSGARREKIVFACTRP
jgi:hypothetical protein